MTHPWPSRTLPWQEESIWQVYHTCRKICTCHVDCRDGESAQDGATGGAAAAARRIAKLGVSGLQRWDESAHEHGIDPVEFAPVATALKVRLELTDAVKARVLREALFDELDNKPLFMSATLRDISVPPNKRLRSPVVVRAHFGSVL